MKPSNTIIVGTVSCLDIEMSKYIDCSKYLEAVDKMLEGLSQNYTSRKLEKSNVLLADAMYSRPDGHKPEGAIYGDYFHIEALTRKINPNWKRYW